MATTEGAFELELGPNNCAASTDPTTEMIDALAQVAIDTGGRSSQSGGPLLPLEYLPNRWERYAVGGLFVALGAASSYLGTGTVAGAAIYALLFQDGAWPTTVQAWRLFAGRILVGVGTRLGKRCPSRHGVCGVGSGFSTSIVNGATFVLVAVVTAQLVAALGVSP